MSQSQGSEHGGTSPATCLLCGGIGEGGITSFHLCLLPHAAGGGLAMPLIGCRTLETSVPCLGSTVELGLVIGVMGMPALKA